MADAPQKLAASYAQLGADAERFRANSAEALWILHGVVPPKLPDAVSTTAELNPLRRAEKKADADAMMRGGRETWLDYSAARPPANGRGR
jgi:hypothetical protein